ncbi:ATP phosphoribosyltransferase [candidate division WOR-3 bacterium 4484_100]|uniref:ATP phosphoribosyltransferase n=1 Tax=candidate division WOR-3 bacterium 4484_100 TaxID=1936077 RepID=A0A1V4QIA4_UNCW3|nr:MAG: ATP phosphoribosyltransferase [candidate division WOR-3 bacterium 4484_100]
MSRLKVVIPKGSIYEGVVRLFQDAGIYIEHNDRSYRPKVSIPELEIKIMRPQNIPRIIELGSHDVGFTGYDWVVETDADVVEVLDLGLNPVRIVAAIPDTLTEKDLHKKQIVVASEYERISRKFLEKNGYDYIFLQTYGATEVFPPDDADMIIDNTTTGRTLREHNLQIIDTILESSTRFIAHKPALDDTEKREKIFELKMLFQAVLEARERVMLEMNVPPEKFERIVKILPCMRSPTIAPLYGDQGYAIKIAVKKKDIPSLIPKLKKFGAVDILEYELRKVVS